MKKIFSVAIVLMFVLSLACPVFAAEGTFVPSIPDKGAPDFVVDENGNIGVVLDADGNVIDYLKEGCLLITSVAEAQASTEIPSAAKELLLNVYEKLDNGDMVLPAEKLDSKLESDEIVIRDLVDLSWMCEDHPEMVEPKGVVFKISLRLGVDANTKVYAMTYKNDEWNPIVDVVNNGDGTVSCTFEDLCPVAFIVGEDADVPTTGYEFDAKLMFWTIMLVASAAAIVVISVSRRKVAQK